MAEAAFDLKNRSLIRAPDHFTGDAHGTLLHPVGAKGVVTTASRVPYETRDALGRPVTKTRWREQKISDLANLPYVLRNLEGVPQAYLSQQRFIGWRRISQLLELGACYIDLDFRRTRAYARAESSYVADCVLFRLQEQGIPQPWIIHTGRGLLALWPIEPVPRKALDRWKAVQKYLAQALHGFGVDKNALDAARVFRVVGSMNTRAVEEDQRVEVLHQPDVQRWSFDDLAYEVLPFTREEVADIRVLAAERAKRRREGRKFVPNKHLTFETLWETRLTDLQRLRHHRWFGTLPPGQRDTWLFLACNAMSYLAPPNVFRREFYALAQEVGGWDQDESNDRMHTVFERAWMATNGEKIEWRGEKVDPRYRFKANTIIEWLEIDECEMREAGLRNLVTPSVRREIETDERRAKRRQEGVQDRQAYRERVQATARRVREFRASGWTHKAIAAELGITEKTSRNAVSRAS